MMRFLFLSISALLLLLLGIAVGIRLYMNLTVEHWDVIAPDQLYSADQPLPLPSLMTITGDTADNPLALKRIVDYAHQNTVLFSTLFQETDSDRALALWVMYEIHLSHIYGTPTQAVKTLSAYLQSHYSECSSSTQWQGVLLDALGLKHRAMGISGDTHAFMEVEIAGNWEIFDSTINVWINRDAAALMRGDVRASRSFYTPLLNAEDARLVTADNLRAAQELRISMPLLGLVWTPKSVLIGY